LIRATGTGGHVPKELKSKDEFQKILESATEIRVHREGEEAKLKLRTKEALYTFKTTAADADSLTKGIKTPIVEF
jgi:3-oxoacyl-[acyl-carrier-protein] synthase III